MRISDWSSDVCSSDLFPTESKTAVDAMTKAESAMQQAKSAGRDCLRFFALSEAQRRGYRASMGIGEEVQLALKENRIVLAHQPVVDATTQIRRASCRERVC